MSDRQLVKLYVVVMGLGSCFGAAVYLAVTFLKF